MIRKNSGDSQAPPVAVGDEIKAKVLSVGEKGDGIVRVKGFIVFVGGVKQGEYIKIKITKVSPKVGFGQFVEKVEPFADESDNNKKRYGGYRGPRKIPTPDELLKRYLPPKEDVSEFLHDEGDSEDF